MKKQAAFGSHLWRSAAPQPHRAVIKLEKTPGSSLTVPVSCDDLTFLLSHGIGFRLKKCRLKILASVRMGIPNEMSNSSKFMEVGSQFQRRKCMF